MTDWLNQYVGIPYEVGGRGPALDCWGLCCLVYQNELGIVLPDLLTDENVLSAINMELILPGPADYCLIKTARGGRIPDHYGVYYKGYVLSTTSGGSACVKLDDYITRYPDPEYVAVDMAGVSDS